MAGLRLPLTGLGLAALTLLAGWALFPDRNLRLEAELARLTPEAAFDRLQTEADVRPLGAYLAFRQADLAARMGRDAQAADILETLATQSPPSAQLFDARAALALRAGQPKDAARLMAAAQRAVPDPERRQRLGHLYRQLRDDAAELDLLSGPDPADLTAFERLRLADLMTASEDPAAVDPAASVLAAIIAQDRDQAAEAVIRLTIIRLQTGQSDRLGAEAVTWLGRPDGAVLMSALARTLAASGVAADAMARDLAQAAPQARAALVTGLTDGGQMAAARAVLSPWMADLRVLQPGDWAALIHYAERSGDLGPLHAVLQTTTPGAVPGAALMPILRYQGAAALLPYRQHLTPQAQDEAPLVAAGWAAFRQTPDQAYSALLRAAAVITLPQDRALWRNLAASLASSGVEARLMQASDPAIRAMFSD